ncbi:MAG: complex I subunit 5 family protein [Fidelibacterota bacterium]
MVNPFFIFIITLGTGLLLPLIDRFRRIAALILFYGALIALMLSSGQWLLAILQGAEAMIVSPMGRQAAISIHLKIGVEEAIISFLVNLVGLLSAFYLFSKFKRNRVVAMVLFLLMLLSFNGMIMTRNLFHLFIFMQIGFIATAAIVRMEQNLWSLRAGLKYFMVSGVTAVLLLIGLIYLHRLTGTLNIDTLLASKELLIGKAGYTALFLFIVAIIIELKPFPVNGWALDILQTVDSGLGAFVVPAGSVVLLFVIYKLMPLFDGAMLDLLAGIGGTTFVFVSLLGQSENNVKRLLGYSSVAQTGLVLMALSLLYKGTCEALLNDYLVIIVGGLLVNHILAKAGLGWLAGFFKNPKITRFSAVRRNPLLLFLFGSFVLALIGMPPFPGFWAKWELLLFLAESGQYFWIVVVLLGSLFEAVYLIRWLIIVIRDRINQRPVLDFRKILPLVLFGIALFNTGLLTMIYFYSFNPLYYIPLLVAAFFFGMDWLPAKVKGLLSILMVGIFTNHVIPQLEGIWQLFGVLLLGGALILLIATLQATGRRKGFYPLTTMLLLSLGLLVKSSTTVQFFYAWMLVMISSFFLVLRSKNARQSGFLFFMFTLAGADCILLGFAGWYAATGSVELFSLLHITASTSASYGFLLIGFAMNVGILGLHIWLPGSYADSEDDVTPLLSAVLSKTGIFGIVLVSGLAGSSLIGRLGINAIIGWLGVATALVGTLQAVFQKDIKNLLAYASLGQMGMVLFAVAMQSHLGWMAAFHLSLHHLLYMALLFLAVAGVISQTGTRKMDKMGGLFRKMPFSTAAICIAVITLAGIPPFAGFGSKWLLVTAGMERGWYFRTAAILIACMAVFIYCFRIMRIIYPTKKRRKKGKVKEASLWYLIPQYLLLAVLILISLFPSLVPGLLAAAVRHYFPATVDWGSQSLFSRLGYWSGLTGLFVTIGLFILPLLIYILSEWNPRFVQRIKIMLVNKQAMTDHYAKFLSKMLNIFKRPLASRFWETVADWMQSLAGICRRVYSGNGQTDALYVIMYVVLLYLISGVLR